MFHLLFHSMVEIFGMHLSTIAIRVLLVVIGAMIYGLFRDIIPDWIQDRRETLEQENKQIEKWYSECLTEATRLNRLVNREIKNPDPDYAYLQEEFDDYADSIAKLADDHRSPDPEISTQLGKLANGTVHMANLCEIYSEYSGPDRMYQVILLQDAHGADLSIDGAMQLGEEMEALFDISPGISQRHINEDRVEEVMDKYDFSDEASDDVSIKHPLIADLFTTIDESQVDRISDEIFRKVLSDLLLEVSSEMREDLINSKNKELN